ncbi:MerR family DNA-binding transcriptional regulator [Bradyrhizobium jicamae]|nr:MerR family transcriptional regulator [Bradyrhizobium jicamae]
MAHLRLQRLPGVTVRTLHHYEHRLLTASERTDGVQRMYDQEGV